MIDVPLIYRNGKRFGQLYHARLRTDCSSLITPSTQNIIDSPLCICGRTETANHDLFECNRLNEFRRQMMQPQLDRPLYCSRELSDESNEHICISVQEFLIKTKRFN